MSAVGASFWAGLPFGPGVKVLAHDVNGLAGLDKPAGVLSHPNQKSDQPKALLDAHYALDGEFYQWKDAAGSDRGCRARLRCHTAVAPPPTRAAVAICTVALRPAIWASAAATAPRASINR